MAQTNNTPIKGAFFGILVLFGIFVLGAWFFDHLTGRGLNVEPKVLSIGVYAPAVPESQWGDASHGLRCKLNFSRPDPSQFIDMSINIQYENITKKPINFLFDPNETLKAVSAVNKDNWKLKLTPILKDITISDDDYRKMYESSVHTIKPGEIFEGKIKCQIDNAVKDTGFMFGYFGAVLKLAIGNKTISQVKFDPDPALWTGKIKSGVCPIYLTMPHDGGCNDCHGDADYHHGVLHDCRFCHAESTDILHDTCARCHKRDDEKVYGRRRVLGPEGDFDNPSKHIPGIIKDDDCLMCHDMSTHGDGVVRLIDPCSPGRKIWTGSDTEFCLSCHNSNPPEYVKFPEEKPDSQVKTAQNTSTVPQPYNYPVFEPFTADSNSYSEAQPGYQEVGTSGYQEAGTSISPEAGTSGYQEVENSGYPDMQAEIEGNTGSEYGSITSPDSMLNPGENFHTNTGVSIYDKSDFRNSVLYQKGVQCTDCHRSHGSNRHDLLKNIHGKDDKVRI